MKKKPMAFALCLSMGLLSGCGIFPKEEELQRTPIIQAYEQEPFRKVQVQKGELKQYEKLDVVCMSLGEKRYSFSVNDMAYKGIYVKNGDYVKAGTLLADLIETNSGLQATNTGSMKLIAEEDGKVTFVKGLEQGERSVSGQIVVTTNSREGFFLSASTKYWDRFTAGQEVTIRIRGKEYTAVVVEAQVLGIESPMRPSNPEEESAVYFHLTDESAYLQSGDSGEINLLVSEKENVLYIPNRTVTTVNDRKIVYVEDENGIRGVRDVETGLVTDKYIEIVSGLKEGDSVIVE